MSGAVRSYRDLLIWQKGMAIVDETYKLMSLFPKEETFGLVSQLKRSSVSIPSNIAEGWGRDSTQSYKQFLRIARGSLFELETQLEISKNQGFLKGQELNRLLELITEESKMITAFINSIKDKKD